MRCDVRVLCVYTCGVGCCPLPPLSLPPLVLTFDEAAHPPPAAQLLRIAHHQVQATHFKWFTEAKEAKRRRGEEGHRIIIGGIGET